MTYLDIFELFVRKGNKRNLNFKLTKQNNLRIWTMFKIAKKIGGRMEEVDIALKRLKEAVVEDQLSSANVPQDCCVDGEYQENVRFRTHVRILLLFYPILFCMSKRVFIYIAKMYAFHLRCLKRRFATLGLAMWVEMISHSQPPKYWKQWKLTWMWNIYNSSILDLRPVYSLTILPPDWETVTHTIHVLGKWINVYHVTINRYVLKNLTLKDHMYL